MGLLAEAIIGEIVYFFLTLASLHALIAIFVVILLKVSVS